MNRRKDRLHGLAIIVLAFGGCMGLSLWGMRVSTPRPAPAPLPASQEGLKGFPNVVRPFEVVERARGLTLRQKFRGFEAQGVKKDGTLDFTRKDTSLRLSFQSPQGRGPQPVREPGTLPSRRYCGTQSVVVNVDGISTLEDRPNVSCGGKDILDLEVSPACSLRELWQIAEKKKFSAKGTARIEYFQAHDEPAFRFEKDGKNFVVSAHDCKLQLKGRAQRGTIPRP